MITEHVPSVRSVSFGFWIGTGSRDETDARAGVSHFIEHLLFKGTSTHSAQEIAEIFDGLGGELNAATSRETTLVYARVPDDRLEPALDVMAGMVYAPAFAEIDSEREVVLEEIAMVDDNPQDLVHDVVAEAVFGGHPLGRPVIGRAEVISTVSRRALIAYHRAAYAADNIVVAAAGNVTHDRVVELLGCPAAGNRVATPARAQAASRVPPPGLPLPAEGDRAVPRLPRRAGISRRDERRFAASLLDSILGGSASSRLFQEIREKRGMAYSVYSFASQYSDSGQIGLYVGTREENLVECFEIVARELADVAAGNVRAGRARAGAGEPERPDAALARVDLEPDEPAGEVADHRHRAALARRAGRARSRRSPPTRSPRSPPTCCGSTASPRPGSARARRASAQRSQRVNPALVERAAA